MFIMIFKIYKSHINKAYIYHIDIYNICIVYDIGYDFSKFILAFDWKRNELVFVVGAWYLSDLLLQGLFIALEKLYIALVPVFYYIHNFAGPWHWIFMITYLSDV